MAELKTRETDASVDAFLDGVVDETRRQDARAMLTMMSRITGWPPKMWGESIIGFGRYRYTNASGRGGEFFVTGFSPRNQALTVYIMPGFDQYEASLSRLGKYKTGRSCLYVRTLADVDVAVLEDLIDRSVTFMRDAYGV